MEQSHATDVEACRIEHIKCNVFNRTINKIYYRCPFCHREHSHGISSEELQDFKNIDGTYKLDKYIHRGTHCQVNKKDVKIFMPDVHLNYFHT